MPEAFSCVYLDRFLVFEEKNKRKGWVHYVEILPHRWVAASAATTASTSSSSSSSSFVFFFLLLFLLRLMDRLDVASLSDDLTLEKPAQNPLIFR